MIPNEPKITPNLIAEHGLKPDEYAHFRALIGREPSFTELGIVSAMWNEHCSYKSSKVHLRGLPTKAPWVIQGPGENALVFLRGQAMRRNERGADLRPLARLRPPLGLRRWRFLGRARRGLFGRRCHGVRIR